MHRLLKNRPLRFLLLRCSSLQLATVLLAAMSLLVGSLVLSQAETGWLLLLLALLVVALLAVLLRLGPVMWRDLVYFRKLTRVTHIPSMHNHVAWRFKQSAQGLIEQCWGVLAERGYAVRQTQQDGMTVLTAMQGRWNRLGFILLHGAILLILLGALLDSDVRLRYQSGSGELASVPATTPLNEMHGRSRISARSGVAFQGREQLLSGQMSDEVRVFTPQGTLARHLPFAVAIDGVELDARQLLQENNFLTRISILDPHRNQPVRALLGSNRPFHYRGLDYYQQSVTDGGSELTLAMWPLGYAHSIPLKFHSQVGAERQLQTRQGTINIRLADLKPRNVMPMQAEVHAASEIKNVGPSLFYTVNDESGREREFVNYMLPVLQNGRYFFISGFRNHADGSFHFMHLPVDREGGLNLFFDLYAALYDQARLDTAIDKVLSDTGRVEGSPGRAEFRQTLTDMLQLFRQGGFPAVNKNIADRVEPQHYAQSRQVSYKLVRSMVYALYKDITKSPRLDETGLLFFEDALPVLARLAEVDMPFYVQLQDMSFKPLVTLLVSYKPGEAVFFTGWVLLLLGLGARFYTYHRRVWLVFKAEADYTSVSIAGMGNRQGLRFAREFNRLFAQLQKTLHA